MEYKILKASNTEKLCDQVKELISENWRPQGGIAVALFNDTVYVTQAMVRTAKKKAGPRFKAPTLQEVQDYINEKKYDVDPVKFVSFYQAKNWMVGKNKMSSWKAALSNWNSGNKSASEDTDKRKRPSTAAHQSFEERQAEEAAYELAEAQSKGFNTVEDYRSYQHEVFMKELEAKRKI